ncbi:UNVERIFIED_CONTAM: Tmem33 [Trichonephila clavipes]
MNNVPGKVIVKKGSCNIHHIASEEMGETITVLACCNAEGNFPPPYPYLSLLPVFLFALLHSVTYSAVLLNKLGCAAQAASLSAMAENHQRNILKLVSFTEVCLMPITVIWLFSGKGSLLTPFAYYRFLTFRYASRRNPYTRYIIRIKYLLLIFPLNKAVSCLKYSYGNRCIIQ